MTSKNKTYTAPNKPIFVPEEERLVEDDKIFIPAENTEDLLEQKVKAVDPIISLQQ